VQRSEFRSIVKSMLYAANLFQQLVATKNELAGLAHFHFVINF